MNLSKIFLQHITSILVLLISTNYTTKAQYPVLLHEGMVFNISAKGESHRLVDRQYELLKNPPKHHQAIRGGFPWDKSFQENGWNRSFIGPFNSPDLYQNQNLYYPLEVIIDLGEVAVLTEFCLADLHGEGKIKIEIGSKQNWKSIFHQELKQTFTWYCKNKLQEKGQYLKLTLNDPSANIGELFLQTQKPLNNTIFKKSKTSTSTLTSPTMDRFIGVNINTEDPSYLIAPFSFVREYHDWQLDIGSHQPDTCHAYQWNPCNAYEGWHFDRLYQELVDNRTTIAANLKGTIPALQQYTNEDKPLKKGADPRDPKSYIQHAEYLYQFAARYGHQKTSTKQLQNRVSEKAVTGLGLITYLEDWNEQDKYWMGATGSLQQEAAYFSPFEYAAMLSADYDGHESTLQFTIQNQNCSDDYPVGIKNADPGMKVVMSGITGLNLDYVKGIQLWARMNRKDQAFPADVLNFHHYSNNFGGQSGPPKKNSHGVSPEEDQLYQKLKSIVDYRNKYLPEKELWLSEFGYDVHPQSPQKAPPIGPFTSEEVQAQWVIRSFLAIAAAGFDKAQLFTMTDGYKSNPAQMFSTCGLVELAKEQDPTTPLPDFTPRTVWYYVYTMKNRLKGFRFKQILSSNVENVNIYEFESGKNPDQKVYAVWATSSKNHLAKNVRFKSTSPIQNATQVNLQHGDLDGITKPLFSKNNQFLLKEVSECPIFILVNQKVKNLDGCGKNIALAPSMIRQEGKLTWGNPVYLIDEPFLKNGSTRQPICGLGGQPHTPWMQVAGQSWPRTTKEMATIIDLQQTHLINGISIFDMNNEGWLRIEYGEPGQWKTWSRYRTRKYKEWKSWWNLSLKTRYIKVIYEDPRAVIGEIILRGDSISE